jgi:hypothetical protein
MPSAILTGTCVTVTSGYRPFTATVDELLDALFLDYKVCAIQKMFMTLP